MERTEKTVFLSYRRTNIPWALAIYQDLTQHGYDVFFDYAGIASGDFERVILENIVCRAHFLVLLTPSALERCSDPNDWLRREIETALNSRRNTIPLMLESFDFRSPRIANQLTGKLAALGHYNGLSIPPEYFPEAMARLRQRYLNVPLAAVLHPASLSAVRAASQQKAAAEAAPVVLERELNAQQWFERGFAAGDTAEGVRFYSEAIRLEPNYAVAFYNRGRARSAERDSDGALRDFTEAIRLQPDYPAAFYNRGVERSVRGDMEGALRDYTEAINLKPHYPEALNNRGNVRSAKGDSEGALKDYTEAIRLKPDDEVALNNRGVERSAKGDLEGALRDYAEAIRLRADYPEAFYNRGNALSAKGDLEGSLRDFTEAIRLQPDSAAAYYNRGKVRSLKGDLNGAAQDQDDYRRLSRYITGGRRDGAQTRFAPTHFAVPS